MAFTGAPTPSREPPIDAQTQLFRDPWLIWFRNLLNSVSAAPTQVPGGKVQLASQSAAIGTTVIPTATLAAGLYRVSYYALVTAAAGVSSSFQVTILWTRNGVVQTWTGVLENGNTTTTFESSGPPLIHIDAGTTISFAVAYASNPAAAMIYEFNLQLDLVSAD